MYKRTGVVKLGAWGLVPDRSVPISARKKKSRYRDFSGSLFDIECLKIEATIAFYWTLFTRHANKMSVPRARILDLMKVCCAIDYICPGQLTFSGAMQGFLDYVQPRRTSTWQQDSAPTAPRPFDLCLLSSKGLYNPGSLEGI